MWAAIRELLTRCHTPDKAFLGKPVARPVIVVIVILQLMVPGLVFLQEPPGRLGWQMYSGLGEIPKIRIETADGAVREIPFTNMAATRRPEINWGKHLPAHVCNVIPDVAAVDLIYADVDQSFACGP